MEKNLKFNFMERKRSNRPTLERRSRAKYKLLTMFIVFCVISSCTKSEDTPYLEDLGYQFAYIYSKNWIEDFSHQRYCGEPRIIVHVDKYINFDKYIVVKSLPDSEYSDGKLYVIIDKESSTKMGPYLYKEFLDSCNSLGLRLL